MHLLLPIFCLLFVCSSVIGILDRQHLIHYSMDYPAGRIYTLTTSNPLYNARWSSGRAEIVTNEKAVVGTGSLLLKNGIFRLPSITMGDNGMTITFWFKSNAPHSQYVTVCSFRQNKDFKSEWKYYAYSGVNRYGMLPQSPFSDNGEWTMVTIVTQSNEYGSISIYYNGVLDNSYSSGGFLKGQTYDANYIGDESSIMNDNLIPQSSDSYLDDFRIINKSLAANEVYSLYEETKLISSYPSMAPTTRYDPRMELYFSFDRGEYFFHINPSYRNYIDRVGTQGCYATYSLIDWKHKVKGTGSLANLYGSTDYSCSLSYSAKNQDGSLDQRSFSLWYKMYQVQSSSLVETFDILSVGSRTNMGIRYNGHRFYYGNLNYFINNPTRIDMNYAFPVDNNWHFVVFVNDAFDWHCYLDGQWVGHLDVRGISDIETPNIRIGKIKGWVDDFRIYKFTFNASYVESLYQSYSIPANNDDVNHLVDSNSKSDSKSSRITTLIVSSAVAGIGVLMIGIILYFCWSRHEKISSTLLTMITPAQKNQNNTAPPIPLGKAAVVTQLEPQGPSSIYLQDTVKSSGVWFGWTTQSVNKSKEAESYMNVGTTHHTTEMISFYSERI